MASQKHRVPAGCQMLIGLRRIGALTVLSALLAFGSAAYATSPPVDPPISVVPGDGRGSIGIGVHNYPIPPGRGGYGGPGYEGVSVGGASGDICGNPTIICPAAVQAHRSGTRRPLRARLPAVPRVPRPSRPGPAPAVRAADADPTQNLCFLTSPERCQLDARLMQRISGSGH